MACSHARRQTDGGSLEICNNVACYMPGYDSVCVVNKLHQSLWQALCGEREEEGTAVSVTWRRHWHVTALTGSVTGARQAAEKAARA